MSPEERSAEERRRREAGDVPLPDGTLGLPRLSSVYAVVFSNYYPAETDGVYADREDAETRAAELNAEGRSVTGGEWHAEEWNLR